MSDEEILERINTARSGSPPVWDGPELELVLREIVLAKARREEWLEDFKVTGNGPGTYDVPAGSTAITLPAPWVGRRIRLYRNGAKFYAYTRTSTGITLSTPGDVVMQDDIFDFENY